MSLTLNSKIQVGKSPIGGKGLFAKENFKKDEQFRVVNGKAPTVIMTDKEFREFIKARDSYNAVALGNGTHRVGILSREEDPSSYGNHSCEPNIAPNNGKVIALRDINAGHELTIDYAPLSSKWWEMKCNCGAKTCRGVVRGTL